MRMAKAKLGTAAFLTLLGVLGTNQWAHAQFTISDLNHFREMRSPNTVGIGQGDLVQFGADVLPNVGTTMTVSQTRSDTGQIVSFTVRCAGLTTRPDFCGTAPLFDPALTGSWSLTFRNGSNEAPPVATPTLDPRAVAGPVPFPLNVTISNSGTTPTLAWTNPPDFSPNVIRLQIFDKNRILVNGQADVIFATLLPGTATSFTVPATFGDGQSLQLGHPYALNVQLIETRDGTAVTGNPNANISRRSSSFVDFTPMPQGTTVGFNVAPGATSVNIAGTYGANNEFTIDTCPVAAGCSGAPARFEIDPGQAVDLTHLTDFVITANVPGALTLTFTAAFPAVPSDFYSRAARVDGQFFPAGAAPFGGLAYTAQANGDVINAFPPGPNDVAPSIEVSNAELLGSAFSKSIREDNIACFGGETAPCTPTVVGSITFNFISAGDQVFLPNSVSIAAARITGAAGVQAIETGLTNVAHVQPPIKPDGSSVFSANRGALPAKFTLTVNGASTCQLPPARIAVFRMDGASPGRVAESDYILPSDTGSSFRIDDCQYVYELHAAALGPGVYRVTISIDGATVGTAKFVLAQQP